MKPELVCKIEVRTEEGEENWGSGYPIAPNRIITAAHVVADAARIGDATLEEDARHIRLTFGPTGKIVEQPVYLEWFNEDVDVAVLRCELPDEFRPTHQLLTEPRTQKTDWEAKGFTVYGDKNRQNKMDDLHGRLASFSEADSTVVLEAGNAPLRSKQWKGGSGSVAFEEKPPTALAVITDYVGGKKLDELIGIPICYLLNSEATKDSFRDAIRFDLYEKQEDYRNQVIDEIAKRLTELGEHLAPVVETILPLLGDKASEINPADKNYADLAHAVAAHIVNDCAINEVVGVLVGLMEEGDPAHSRSIADIIDHLLPLNYAPHIIHRLREQLAKDSVGLVENEVATRTLAEIIMAGYDQQATRFAKFRDSDRHVRGRTALDPHDGPEEGPSDSSTEMSNVLREVRNFLYDILAEKDNVLMDRKKASRSRPASPASDSDVKQEIEDYASRLRGPLTAISRMHHGRTVYCVLQLPVEESQRDFRKKVLREVRQRVPQLIFVELMPAPKDDSELEIDTYIQARLVRSQ